MWMELNTHDESNLFDECIHEMEDFSLHPVPLKDTTQRTVLDEEEDLIMTVYPYSDSKRSFLFHYIYPFWRKEFLQTKKDTSAITDSAIAFLSDWTPQEVMIHNMGLRANTLCFQLEQCDVPIGFCSVLEVDRFDRESDGEWSAPLFQSANYLYNFVLEEPFRGQGFGKLFLQRILDIMRNRGEVNGNTSILLAYDREKEYLQRFYESTGFK